MRHWIRRGPAFGVLAALLGGCAEPGPSTDQLDTGVLAIEGATVFTSPRAAPIEDGVVLVVDGLIEAVGVRGNVPIPPAAIRIDGTGLSLLPGFWNAGVMAGADLLAAAVSGSAQDLQRLLQERFTRFGFTSIVETATPPALLQGLIERIQSGEVPGPRIVAVGGASVAGVQWAGAMELLGPEASLEPWARGDIALVPSLRTLQEEIFEGVSVPGAGDPMAVALDRLAAFVDAGGRLVFGTGAGYVEHFDPISDHILLEEAGIPFAVRLAALTTEPATRFGFSYVGEIEPGMVADLVLLDADPEVDATAFGQVRVVFREGRPLFVR